MGLRRLRVAGKDAILPKEVQPKTKRAGIEGSGYRELHRRPQVAGFARRRHTQATPHTLRGPMGS
eukprot:9466769-Pyramimonas_sp.AAC.1